MATKNNPDKTIVERPKDASGKKLGRPFGSSTGHAKTPTQRVRELDAVLLKSGGRILNRVRLSAEAAAALGSLSELHGSDRAAIEHALLVAAKTS